MREPVCHRDRPADRRLRLVHHRFARRDADPERQRVAELLLQAPSEGERRVQRPLDVVLLRDGSAEDGDDRAAGRDLNAAAALVDLERQVPAEAVEERCRALRIVDPERRQRAGEIGREHGDELALGRCLADERGRRRLGRRRRERLILSQDRRFELLQLAARFDAQAADERVARVPVGGERLGLAAGAVQREHVLAPEALPERLGGDEGLELADQLRVAAEGEVGLDPLLERVQTELLEPCDLALDELLVTEIGERRAAPEPERVAQAGGRQRSVAIRERAPPVGEQALEAQRIELIGLEAEHIPRRPCDEQVAIPVQRLAELRHAHAHGRLPAQGLLRAPELVEQALFRHDLVRPQEERGQEGALLRTGQRDAAVAVEHFEWAEDLELHRAFCLERTTRSRRVTASLSVASRLERTAT